jgi:primosomal protein N'
VATIVCKMCQQPFEATQASVGRKRLFCDPCRAKRNARDHSLRCRERYWEARNLGLKAHEASSLARSSNAEFKAKIAELKAKKDANADS